MGSLVDWLAIVVAIVSIWIAIVESRRNNSVVICFREVQCLFPTSIYENQGKHFIQLRILLFNRGISLHSPSLSLSFRESKGWGRVNYPIKSADDQTGELSKGMITEFTLKSYKLNSSDMGFLSALKNAQRQDAQLCIYSQGFLAKSFSIGGFKNRLAARWNRFARRVNQLFEHHITSAGGRPALSAPNVLPIFLDLDFQISSFVRALEKHSDGKKP